MGRDGARVPAGGGSGDARDALGESPVEGGLEEGAHVQGGVVDAGRGEDARRLDGDAGDEVGAVGEARVVEGAVLLGDDDGLAAHFDDEGLGDRQEGRRRRHREGGAHEAGHVDAGPREGHRRVDCQGDRSGDRGRRQQPDARGARQVDDDVSTLPGAEVGEAGREGADLVVGHGQDDDLRASGDLLGGRHGHPGQHRVGPLARGVRRGGHGDDLVPDRAQGGADDGADVAHADDADTEASGGAHSVIVADPRLTRRAPSRARSPRRPR